MVFPKKFGRSLKGPLPTHQPTPKQKKKRTKALKKWIRNIELNNGSIICALGANKSKSKELDPY